MTGGMVIWIAWLVMRLELGFVCVRSLRCKPGATKRKTSSADTSPYGRICALYPYASGASTLHLHAVDQSGIAIKSHPASWSTPCKSVGDDSPRCGICCCGIGKDFHKILSRLQIRHRRALIYPDRHSILRPTRGNWNDEADGSEKVRIYATRPWKLEEEPRTDVAAQYTATKISKHHQPHSRDCCRPSRASALPPSYLVGVSCVLKGSVHEREKGAVVESVRGPRPFN